MKKRVLPAAAACILLITAFSACTTKTSGKTYEYTSINRGSLEKTVSSSGTLQPVSTVSVLAQMNGKVEKINVDYNDTIKKDQVLAELNTDMLRLQREQQMASVIKARANYELQKINYDSQVALANKNLISEYELKTGKTTLDIQAAELSAAEASLKVIETEINQYAYITSPINGIVLVKNISVGQNVVEGSSSNASSLFTLAENLDEMQIEAKVDELDIVSIHNGQSVRFTLEAMPGKTFSGTVDTIHLMPTTTDNVVTYTVIVNVDNKDGSLLPGMTCEVEFIEERRENVLLVPNAALRYQPTGYTAEEIAEKVFLAGLVGLSETDRAAAIDARAKAQASAQQTAASSQTSGGLSSLVMPTGPGMGRGGMGGNRNQQGQGNTTGNGAAAAPRTIWYMGDSGKPEVMLVRGGSTDGSFTEVMSMQQNLEGMKIILREKV